MFDIFNMLKKEEHKDAKQVTRETIIGDILDMDQTTAARASRRPVLSTAWTAMS